MFPMPSHDEIKGSQQSGEGGLPPTNNGFNKSVLQVVHIIIPYVKINHLNHAVDQTTVVQTTVDGSEIPNNHLGCIFNPGK